LFFLGDAYHKVIITLRKMKPFLHGRIHARKYGGHPDDYADIDDFIDSSKQCFPDIRHRALLHSSFGCYLVEQMFGRTRINSDGKEYSPRDIAEDHIIQDLGFIPTVENYLNNMTVEPWMSGTNKKETKGKRFIPID
jgi:hypothetical protein